MTPAVPEPGFKPSRILVVDDDRAMCQLLIDLLREPSSVTSVRDAEGSCAMSWPAAWSSASSHLPTKPFDPVTRILTSGSESPQRRLERRPS